MNEEKSVAGDQMIFGRLNDNVVSFFGPRETEDMPARINSALLRYISILDQECPELTSREWMSILDTLNSTYRNISHTDGDIARFLYAEIEDADISEGLGAKWKIDAKSLSIRLRGFSYIQQCAIVEVVNRWWAFKNPHCSGEDLIVRLVRHGAKVKE